MKFTKKIKINLYIYIKTIINIIKNKKFIIFFKFLIFILFSFAKKKKYIKVALCTMAKKENLYIEEFIKHYIKLGLDQIFIYDDNDVNTERIKDKVNPLNKKYITIYENIKTKIKNQGEAFTECYNNHKDKYDWFLMVDIDEFLIINHDTLKNYLLKNKLKKCDFIKFHWLIPTDNNLLYYNNKSLFERFKGPYIKSVFIKSIIRGNINNLKYWVHSPSSSPIKNITCNNVGEIVNYPKFNSEIITKINIKNAYFIHFKYKSTEEYINKYKRGYSNWLGSQINQHLYGKIEEYLRDNKITKEKIDYFEKELKLNLTKFKLN